MTQTDSSAAPGVRRRAVVKGAAWATPAVMVAAAAPTAAASAPIVPSFTPGTFCKHPGEPKYYHAVFCFHNTTQSAIVVTLGTLTVGSTSKPATVSVNGSQTNSFTVTAGQNLCLYVDAGLFSTSANGGAVLTFSYPFGGTTQTGSISGGTIVDANLNPCGTGNGIVSDQPKDDPPHATSGP
ncbi:hypothetical protein ACXR8F_18005 [Terrabacter sp. AAH1]